MVKMLATMLDHGCPTMVFIMVFRILPNIPFFSGAQFIKKLKLIYIIFMVDHGQ